SGGCGRCAGGAGGDLVWRGARGAGAPPRAGGGGPPRSPEARGETQSSTDELTKRDPSSRNRISRSRSAHASHSASVTASSSRRATDARPVQKLVSVPNVAARQAPTFGTDTSFSRATCLAPGPATGAGPPA